MVRKVEGTKDTARVSYPSRSVAFRNVKGAKEELDKLLNNNSDPGTPRKYSVSFAPAGNTYTLEVRTKHKKDLPFVDQFLKHGSFWGFKVKKAAVQYKLRLD